MKTGKMELVITNEHGSWAVVFVPMLTAILSEKKYTLELFPLFFLIFFSFMLYKPAEIIAKGWTAGSGGSGKSNNAVFSFFLYGIIASGFLAYEIFFLHNYFLLVFGGMAAVIFLVEVFVKPSGKFSFLREVLGVLILTSTAPITVAALEGTITDFALTLWILNFLFFTSGACFVNFLIDKLALAKGKKSESALFSAKNIHFVYHFALSLFLILFIAFFPEQYFKVLAFVPMIVHAYVIYFSGDVVTNFKPVGLKLLAHSLVFAVLLSIN